MCNLCKDTGLLPFHRKDGSVAPHVYLECDCKDLRETLQPISPDDFDYPMSQSFRAHSFEYCGIPDPGYFTEGIVTTDIEDRLNDLEAEVSKPGGIPRRYTEGLNQLKGVILHLQSKVIEKKKDYEPF